jgi:type II secretory pathway pseudopilin PulG
MMIVVAIVSILGLLAVVGYRKLVLSAHTAEATQMVSSIRVAQEAYHAETQTYVSTTTSLASPIPNLYPQIAFGAVPNNTKYGWGSGASGTCTPPTASVNCWSALPIHIDSAVMYGYATVGGVAGSTSFPALTPIGGVAITLPTSAPSDWYFIGAQGDVNNNGIFCTVIGTSFTNDLFVDRDGE